MIFKSNKSFSNSKFKLINDKKSILLRKYFKKNSNRNFKSIVKQNNFKDHKIYNFNIVSAKTKTSYEIIKKKNYYEMFFYYGKSGDEILQSSNIHEIIFLRDWIKTKFFEKKIKNFYKINTNIFFDKLEQIDKKIKDKKFLEIFTKKYIPDFKKKLIKQTIYYPKDYECHGDFTLSNIIISYSDKRITLIDFLKTYNENIIQDYAKLYQEFKFGWSARYLDPVKNTRSLIVYKNIINDNQWNALDIKIKKAIIVEVHMTLFRILPYIDSDDKITIDWVIQSIKTLRKSNIRNNL